jgi:hypothetical protein
MKNKLGGFGVDLFQIATCKTELKNLMFKYVTSQKAGVEDRLPPPQDPDAL